MILIIYKFKPMAQSNNVQDFHSNIQYLNEESIIDMSPSSYSNQPNYLKENNLTITNTFIDFPSDTVIERAQKLRRTKSLELIILIDEDTDKPIIEDTTEPITDSLDIATTEPILTDSLDKILRKKKRINLRKLLNIKNY